MWLHSSNPYDSQAARAWFAKQLTKDTPMQSKLTSLQEAVASIRPGSRLALGGNTIHRGPCAAVHEIVRRGIGGLEVVKTAGAYDIDLLAAAGLLRSVAA